MGSCVSVHKGRKSDTNPRLSVESKNEKLLIPSPVTEKPDTINGGDPTVAELALESRRPPPRFLDAGSKEETFFDSQQWFDSDCEDDCLCVNGDFTPSRGSAPPHHHFSLGKPPAAPDVGGRTLGPVHGPFPPDRNKSLFQLLNESSSSRSHLSYVDDDEIDASNDNVVPEKARAEATRRHDPSLSVSNSGGSSEATPNGVLPRAEDKQNKSAQCCLPRLLSSRSFGDRKKKTSPAGAHSIG